MSRGGIEEKALPEGWRMSSLADACTVTTSPVDKKTVEGELPVKLCNYTDVYYNNSIDFRINFMTATAKPKEVEKFSIVKDDVIITKDSETPDDIGVPSHVKETIDGLLCGYHLTILRPKKKISGKYVCYALTSQRVKHDFYRYANGITRFGLTNESYQKIKIPLPSLSEQKAIAYLLETWDTAIEKTEALIAAKENRFKWLLCRLFADNEKWNKTYLDNLVKVKKGQQLNRIDLEDTGNYPAWNGGITPSGYTDTWNTPENTVTISEGGNSCGFVNYCKQKFWCGGHCYALINVSEQIDCEFLYYFLKGNEKHIMRLRVGSGLPNIQKTDIGKFEIKYPDRKEQKTIAHTLNTVQNEIILTEQLAERYRKQKRGLMQKLLIGKWNLK